MVEYVGVKQVTLTKPPISQIFEVLNGWQSDNPQSDISDLDLKVVGGITVAPFPDGVDKAEIVAVLIARDVIHFAMSAGKEFSISFSPTWQATKEEWKHITDILDAVKDQSKRARS